MPPKASLPPGNGKPPKSDKPRKKVRRVRQTGDIDGLKRKLWQAIVSAEEIYLDAEVEAPTRLRAITALTQAAMAFAKLIEQTDMADAIARVEAEVTKQNQPAPHQAPPKQEDDLGDDEVWAEEGSGGDGKDGDGKDGDG